MADDSDPRSYFICWPYGVEKIVHEEVRKYGFTVLGTVVESAGANEVGPVTHITTMGVSWYGKSRPVLQFIKEHNGTVIFIGGGDILKDEIKMAYNLGINFHLMKGPEGAANEAALALPAKSFVGANGLVAKLNGEHASLLKVHSNSYLSTLQKHKSNNGKVNCLSFYR